MPCLDVIVKEQVRTGTLQPNGTPGFGEHLVVSR